MKDDLPIIIVFLCMFGLAALILILMAIGSNGFASSCS